jgi:hypothetical protein
MTDQQNQPTRTPPTDREAYRQSLIELRNGLEKEITKLKSVIASIPEPFAPVLPVVELWEGDGEQCIKMPDGTYAGKAADGDWLWSEGDRVALSTNLRRTHTCKWGPCDE